MTTTRSHAENADAVARDVTSHRQARARGVALATLAACAVWVVAVPIGGIDLQPPTFDGSPGSEVGIGMVLAGSLGASLAGWALLGILERFTDRARRLWVRIAVATLLLSFGTPMSGSGTSALNRVVLLLMHVAVGAVLIPMLSRTSKRR